MLTDKAKTEFESWLSKDKKESMKKFYIAVFYPYDDIHKNAYYIEWFDSVGIYINISHDFGGKFFYTVELGEQGEVVASNFLEQSDSRSLAKTAAITEANKIYNEMQCASTNTQ